MGTVWFVCSFMIFSFNKIVLSQSCTESFNVSVPFGQLFIQDGLRTCFFCVIDGMTSSQTTWFVQSSADNSQLQAIDPEHGEVTNGVLVLYNSSTLVKPGFTNAIEAQCSAFTMLYTVHFVSTAFVPPTVQMIMSDMTTCNGMNQVSVNRVTVNKGEDLVLCCMDDNPSGLGVTQKWQRLDGTLMTSDAGFRVENVSRSDAGIYQCIVTNAMNETRVANATVIVQFLGDVISPNPHIQDVSLGDTLVTLSCNFSGIPNPSIQWFHNGTLLRGGGDVIHITTRSEYSEIRLSVITRDSGGVYTCNATNSVDSDDVSVFLRVLVPPAPASNLMLMLNGETSVILSWVIGFDGHSQITGVEIEIFRDDTIQETRVFPGNSIQSAELTGLNPLMSYTFVVRVLNGVGRSDPVSIDESFSLSVVPPAPITNLTITSVSEFSASLSWRNGFNGHAPIIGVEIEIFINGQQVDVRSFLGGPSQELARLTGLEALTDYIFTVYVLNGMHRSEPVSIEASTLSLRLMAPQVTSAVAVSSSSIQIDWEPSPLHDPETTDSPNSWLIEYTYITGQPLTLSLSNPNITIHTFLNLLKGTQYQVRVGGVNVRGVGMYSDYVTVATLSEAPSGGPANFAATSKSRTVTFSWSPPSIAHQNGVILSYTLTCTLQDNFAGRSSEHAQIINRVYHSAGSHVLGGFRPFSTYNCSVLATNSAGNGPPVSLNVNTMDDSQLFQLRLIGIRCADWVITNAAQKAVQLASIITNAVQERCGMCDFSIDRITDGVFQCFPDSSQVVTYRALLHGTVELSALELLDFIEDWSENDESARAIRIDSILLRIDRTCDVMITSKSDGECGLSDGESNPNNPLLTTLLATVFGMLGGIAVIVLVLIIICATIYWRKATHVSSKDSQDQRDVAERQNVQSMRPHETLSTNCDETDGTTAEGHIDGDDDLKVHIYDEIQHYPKLPNDATGSESGYQEMRPPPNTLQRYSGLSRTSTPPKHVELSMESIGKHKAIEIEKHSCPRYVINPESRQTVV